MGNRMTGLAIFALVASFLLAAYLLSGMADFCRDHNAIERMFCRFKDVGRIAIRYDRLAQHSRRRPL
jgi:hypothetical protein